MDDADRIERLELASEGLSDSLGAASTMVAAFDGVLQQVRTSFAETGRDAATLERGMSRGLRRAFDGVIFDGASLSDALNGLARSMANTVFSAAVRPVSNHFNGLLTEGVSNLIGGILPFADGGAFSQGRVMPFATGGIVQGPTMFPMRGGVGLMGEAGPEAIMPLARGADGRLGVRGSAGQTSVTINVSTPDVQSFQRSQGQIAAQMSRALGRANRNR